MHVRKREEEGASGRVGGTRDEGNGVTETAEPILPATRGNENGGDEYDCDGSHERDERGNADRAGRCQKRYAGGGHVSGGMGMSSKERGNTTLHEGRGRSRRTLPHSDDCYAFTIVVFAKCLATTPSRFSVSPAIDRAHRVFDIGCGAHLVGRCQERRQTSDAWVKGAFVVGNLGQEQEAENTKPSDAEGNGARRRGTKTSRSPNARRFAGAS